MNIKWNDIGNCERLERKIIVMINEGIGNNVLSDVAYGIFHPLFDKFVTDIRLPFRNEIRNIWKA